MNEILAIGKTLPEAYHKALQWLYCSGYETECPDYNQKQLECSMTIHVESPLSEPMISKLFIGGFEEIEQYRQEMLDGIMDFLIGHGWDYTYHSRIAEQLPFIYKELKRNPDSRRAVIDVRDWRHDIHSIAPACLQHIQYFIRDNKLHCKVLMRSNDAPEATFMNMFAFIMLQKRIADNLGYEIGSYTHRANSFHCYEKDFQMLENYVRKINTNSIENLTYEYEGYFKELMEDSQEKIKQKVENLKRNINN